MIRADPSDGNGFTCLALAGCVGPFGGGINDEGLACAYTTVDTKDTGPGVNPAILCRLALQHNESVEDLAGLAENSTIYYGCNLVAADQSGVAAVIERTYSHINIRWASDSAPLRVDGDGVLAVSSHFVSGNMNGFGPSMPVYPSSYYRHIRLCQLLHQHKGEIDMEVMKLIDKDHCDVSTGEINPTPNTICRQVYRTRSHHAFTTLPPARCRWPTGIHARDIIICISALKNRLNTDLIVPSAHDFICPYIPEDPVFIAQKSLNDLWNETLFCTRPR